MPANASRNEQLSEDTENKLNSVITDVGEMKKTLESLTNAITVLQQKKTYANVTVDRPNSNGMTQAPTTRGQHSPGVTNASTAGGHQGPVLTPPLAQNTLTTQQTQHAHNASMHITAASNANNYTTSFLNRL